tara:strand:+ start:836 stop:1630 length:795 start_codon:yes stop_codon:yes gene_type:complete
MEKENKFHALQLFTDTFSAETVHLTNEAVGIYIRLLCFAWTKNAKPFTTTSAYRICQCRSDQCEKIVDMVLEEFFKIGEVGKDTWVHKRLKQEHKYLTDKYKARSEAGRKGGLATQNQAKGDFALSKIKAPIPIPSPIPSSTIKKNFEKFWSLISHKKGSKFLASKRFAVHCSGMEAEDIALLFNQYANGVKDKEFLAHVSTWINQRRFEDEINNKVSITSIVDRLKKLGYDHKGREGNFEQFTKNSKNYKIDLLDKDFIIQED